MRFGLRVVGRQLLDAPTGRSNPHPAHDTSESEDHVRVLCIGRDPSNWIALTDQPLPAIVVLARQVEIAAGADVPADVWRSLVPGVIASVALPSALGVVDDSMRIIEDPKSTLVSLLNLAWNRASRSRFLFGFEGQYAYPPHAPLPEFDWIIKRAAEAEAILLPKPEFRDDPQTRLRFRVGKRRFCLPLVGPDPGATAGEVFGPCVVTVGLTPPWQYGNRYKVVVGVLPVPSKVSATNGRR